MKPLSSIREFLSSVSRWGVRSDFSAHFAKRIILTNILGLMFTINMSLSGLAFVYFGHYHLALFTFFFAASEFCWPLLNRAGHYTLARACLMVSSNILGFFVSIALPGTGYNRGFYVMAGLPVLLFELREKRFLLLGLILPLILYPVSEFVEAPAWLAINLTPTMRDFVAPSIGIVYVLLIFLMFYFVSRENEIAESLLEEQRARAFTSAKFAALGEMASGITHEINNPLTVINLHSQNLRLIIENSDSKKDALEKLDLVEMTVHRIGRIVESMSTISRDGSQEALKKESLQRIVDDTITFCTARFRTNRINVRLKLATPISINCRAVQISQLLLNLFNNAIDAIEVLPEKWIELEAKIQNDKVLITVTDSGKGIPKDLHEKIFRPFFTTKPSGKGTGLGLSLSRKIAQDHKGNLFLDASSSNTCFVLELPAEL